MPISITTGCFYLNVEVFSGDTLDNWSIKFIDNAGDPYDITLIDFYYTVKEDISDLDSEAVLNKGPADATKTDSGSGTTDTVAFNLSSAETSINPKTYYHSMKVMIGTDERTWMTGKLVVLPRRIDTI